MGGFPSQIVVNISFCIQACRRLTVRTEKMSIWHFSLPKNRSSKHLEGMHSTAKGPHTKKLKSERNVSGDICMKRTVVVIIASPNCSRSDWNSTDVTKVDRCQPRCGPWFTSGTKLQHPDCLLGRFIPALQIEQFCPPSLPAPHQCCETGS